MGKTDGTSFALVFEKLKRFYTPNLRGFYAFISIGMLIGVSIHEGYHLGMLVGFLIIFVLFYFEHIKRIIIELNIKKIFGVEFNDRVIQNIQQEAEQMGITLSKEDIRTVSDIALNQISGIANKGRYYEEEVGYALQDLGINIQRNLSWSKDGKKFIVDFVGEIYGSKVIGIEAAYSSSRYLPHEKIDQVIALAKSFKEVDDMLCFVLVTNTQIKDIDKKYIAENEPLIEIIENVISPDGILSGFDAVLKKVRAVDE
ncbi:MAG: hypothetical protein AB7E52_05105 [Bdellovibrionales bacterium]